MKQIFSSRNKLGLALALLVLLCLAVLGGVIIGVSLDSAVLWTNIIGIIGVDAVIIWGVVTIAFLRRGYNPKTDAYKDGLRTRMMSTPAEEGATRAAANPPALPKSIMEIMIENMAEVREYFLISKSQARSSFWLAAGACVFGFFLLGASVFMALSGAEAAPAILSAVGGAVSELFAGTVLLVHNRSLAQLNRYYEALHNNERFLSLLNLTTLLSPDKQDDAYLSILQNYLKISLLAEQPQPEPPPEAETD